jgi:hypothetical protein
MRCLALSGLRRWQKWRDIWLGETGSVEAQPRWLRLICLNYGATTLVKMSCACVLCNSVNQFPHFKRCGSHSKASTSTFIRQLYSTLRLKLASVNTTLYTPELWQTYPLVVCPSALAFLLHAVRVYYKHFTTKAKGANTPC